MTIEVLVATMHQKDHSVLDHLNLQSDAVVINQCDENSGEEFTYNGHHILWVNTIQRGISRSRNMALSYAKADICVLADDDEILADGYPELLNSAYGSVPDAAVISFNLERIYSEGQEQNRTDRNRKPNRTRKAPFFRYYSAVSLTFRRMKLVKHGIHFNELIGTGSDYGSGEEAVMLIRCRDARLAIYENSSMICSVDCTGSSWFTGYDEKFYFDTGVFLGCAYGRAASIMALYFLRQSRSMSKLPTSTVWNKMAEGIRAFRAI